MKSAIKLEVNFESGKSLLGSCFFSTPFKIIDITENKKLGDLHLMLMSSSPGMLDGDVTNLNIHIKSNANLQLHTQSYQRLFQMREGATQQMDVVQDENSCFVFLPRPVVPHENSIFKSVNNIYLSKGSLLIWGEVLTCGRKNNGEVFKFTSFQSVTNIFINQRLVVKENLFVHPNKLLPDAIGQLEGFTHQASLLILDEQYDFNLFKDEMVALYANMEGITFGISKLPVNGVVVRMLGYKAELLYDYLVDITGYFKNKKILNGFG